MEMRDSTSSNCSEMIGSTGRGAGVMRSTPTSLMCLNTLRPRCCIIMEFIPLQKARRSALPHPRRLRSASSASRHHQEKKRRSAFSQPDATLRALIRRAGRCHRQRIPAWAAGDMLQCYVTPHLQMCWQQAAAATSWLRCVDDGVSTNTFGV